MKSKVSKSFLTVIACIALVVLAGFVLTACGEKTTNEKPDIYATDYVVNFGGNDALEIPSANFENTDDFALEVVDAKTNAYKAVGSAAVMSEAQSAAFYGGATEYAGSHYIILSIKMETGSTIRRAWVENADVALTDDDKASSYTGTEGVREYLLCIDGNYVDADHTAEPVWKIEVTSPVEEGSEEEPTVVTYTIDFSEMITAIHSAE